MTILFFYFLFLFLERMASFLTHRTLVKYRGHDNLALTSTKGKIEGEGREAGRGREKTGER